MAVTDTGTAFSVNVAVTVESTVRGMEQAPVPAQLAFPVPLLQPAKVEPVAAVAVRSTVPWTSCAEQVAPQLSPAGLDVTVPAPFPALLTVRLALTGTAVNVAVTAVMALSVTTQTPVPVQPPLQPVNPAPVAVIVTAVPFEKSAEQIAPQVIPAGFEVTFPLPLPLPANATESVEKFACKCVAAAPSETNVRPGIEVSKPAAEKLSVAGKFGGAFAGITMEFPGAGAPPARVNSN